MKKNSTKILAWMTLIMSTLMVLSSENWLSMWIGLEINMMSFIPLLKEEKNMNSTESMMTYFLIQSMGSIVFLFTIMINPIIMINDMHMEKIMTIIMSSSMMMKMGIAPMHMWFINMMNKMSWECCMMLMTWQKLAPMSILSQINNNNYMINMCAILSAMIGAIGGINQTSIKKIMAFSSINHLGWMLLCMKYDNEMWMKYLMIYSMIIFMITSTMKNNSINYINQMNMNKKTFMEKTNLIIMFLSLGGLPPFIGFMPKWIVIQSSMNEGSMITIMMIMMTSMITLFYYMRMMSPILMSNSTTNKWNIKKNTKNDYNMMKIMINLSMPMLMMTMNMI